ncbi:MAG: glutamate--tRNA ligase [Gemmatimonadetes bacterium]|nr:glutamate--tRNA ligase [Gemmatimonadota bacterium]
MSPRLRFAPSPTGYLHVGGARTALFNWLLARGWSGTLVLRIEDTDRERSSAEHTRAILDGLGWLGIDWDEGPLYQSDGLERHRADALRLLDEGKAYRDFTTPELLRLEAERRGIENPSALARVLADEAGPDASARRADGGEDFAVRFRVPEGETSWKDLVHGEMRFANADIEDLVLLRSDGTPTYNLAVVSDDADAAITHVVRGDDHVSNTPKQILLYRALGLEVPTFGHVPLILGPDGRRLSKRHGATAVGEYEERGILPEAMVNFLALLGWNPGDEREVMEKAELVEAFSLDRVQVKSAVFDHEKLGWLNGRWLERLPPERVAPLVARRLEAHGVDEHVLEGRGEWWLRLVDLLKARARSVDEVAAAATIYLGSGVPAYDDTAVAKHWEKDPGAAEERLEALRDRLGAGPWKEAPLEERLRALAEARGEGAGKVIHPLRVALTGQRASPGIFEVLVLLGREESLARIEEALRRIRAAAGRSG